MQNKLLVKTIVGIAVIAVLFTGYRAFNEFSADPDLGDFNSVGAIAAIETSREGSRAVIFTADGKRIDPPAPSKTDAQDVEVTWTADGQRLFLSSNRESSSFTVHRWNPASQKLEARGLVGRSQGAPYFATGEGRGDALLVSGGYVLEYNQRTRTTRQLLPPVLKDAVQSDDGSGRSSPLDTIYQRFGTSFRFARWSDDRQSIWAIMRGDEGEAALWNRLGTDEQGNLLPPAPIIRGRHLEMATVPGDKVVVLVRFLEFPPDEIPEQFIKNGKVELPWRHGLLLVQITPEGRLQTGMIGTFPADMKEAFGDLAVSPDGSRLAVVVGEVRDDRSFQPRGLVVMPVAEGGVQQATPLAEGQIGRPAWSPDGRNVAFVKREGEFNNIYRIDVETGAESKVSTDGQFNFPVFSPQVAASE